MRDYIDVGSTPAGESCLQVGADDYSPEAASKECRRFIDLIRKVCGPEPPGARLAVRANPHDFGTYYSVVVYYEDSDEDARDYAFHVEGKSPMRWDGSGGGKWRPPVHVPEDD